jgi:hypothetical protein
VRSIWTRLLLVGLAAGLVLGLAPAGPAAAADNPAGDVVSIFNPIIDADAVHDDVSAWWAWGHDTSPRGHHIVYSNWGYMNDWSIDVFAREAGKQFVTPFGSRTAGGDAVQSVVVGVRPGCRSGNPADGGYRVTVEARNARTGAVIARADLMHVDRPQVSVGQHLGGWTTIGFTSAFRYNSCYQVSNAWGIHGHLEVVNRNRYACFRPMGYEQPLTELTWIGRAGTNYGGQRAAC